jgi:hypothetical protein
MRKGFNKYVDANIALPHERRKRMFVGRKIQRARVKSEDWTRDDLIKWAVQNKITSTRKLHEFVKKNGGPGIRAFNHCFGNWSEFRKQTDRNYKEPKNKWQEPKWKDKMCEYIIDLILLHGISTQKKYIELSKKDPDLYPSFFYVKSHFKTWRDAYHSALRSTANGTLNLYREYRRELGKWPHLGQCAKRKIDLSKFIEVHGSKEEFDEFLDRYDKTGAENANQ